MPNGLAKNGAVFIDSRESWAGKLQFPANIARKQLKISVQPGEVQIAAISVRRHPGGIYTIQIDTPFEDRVGLGFGSIHGKTERTEQVLLYPEGPVEWRPPTTVNLTAETNEEEEALMGLTVTECWSKRSVTLIACPAAILEEAEEISSWQPAGPVDYLDVSTP